MNIKELFGKKIKSLRIKNKMTQQELANLVGISQRSLSGIEIGANFLTAETLTKLLEVLNTRIDELFALEHLQPASVLMEEIINDIKNLKDEEKIRTIYKIVKSLIKD